MKKTPKLYLADEIAFFPECSIKSSVRTFVARPYVPFSLSIALRIKLSIGVFLGKYDAIFYKGDEDKHDGLVRIERERRIDSSRRWTKKPKKLP